MTEKILVVDDEIETLRLVGLTLQRQGYHVIAANNGPQAIDMAQREYPDLIILDIMMPDMDGFEVCRRLCDNERTVNIPILMFSARAQLDDKVLGYEAGADDYLTKPIHPTELVAHVKVLLKRNKERANLVAKQGYIIGTLAARGGLGVSTLLLNLAISYHQTTGKDVIAVEMRPGHGIWKAVSSQKKGAGLGNLLRLKPDEINVTTIGDHLFQSIYGPRLLISSSHIRDVELIKASIQFENIVRQISLMAPLVLLDIGTIFLPNYEKVLSACQEVLVVTEPYSYSLELTHCLINDLTEYGFSKGKPINILSMNRLVSKNVLDPTRMHKILRQPVDYNFDIDLEYGYQAEETNIPIVIDHPDSVFAQQMANLSKSIDERIQKSKNELSSDFSST